MMNPNAVLSRSRRAFTVTVLLMILPAMIGLQGCSWFKRKKPEQKNMADVSAQYQPTPAEQEGVRPPDAGAEGVRPAPGTLRPAGDLMKVIYFDYDDSSIRPDQLARVEDNLKYLVGNPNEKVLIEGHCDERGTTEYNFALGERRARSVAEYFVRSGVAQNRIQILSKGEEEPAVPGSGEEAWKFNRRAEFKFFN